jgi:hypothetical protein
MTATKPTFTSMTTHAFLWFVECYENTVIIAQETAKQTRRIITSGIPTFAEHFLKYYGLTDAEVTAEKDHQKQLDLIQKKYVKG